MRTDVRAKGQWPGRVQLRRGWSQAWARPWNDQSPRLAALRLDRGSDRFLLACTTWLGSRRVERVLSPALAESQTGVWRRAGFADHLELVIYERDARVDAGPPQHPIVELSRQDLDEMAAIDDRAFRPTWRVGREGLADAIAATPLGDLFGVVESERIVGFAIVGELAGVAYLQRLAVDPGHSRSGIGRSLVRAAVSWSASRGARTILLNTQPENGEAASLYRSEGFVALGSRLHVLARDAPRDSEDTIR